MQMENAKKRQSESFLPLERRIFNNFHFDKKASKCVKVNFSL